MNPVLPVALCGMLAGGGLLLIVREFIPSHPRLGAALANLAPGNLVIPDTAPLPAPRGRERIGALAETRLAGLPGFGAPTADLRLLGQSERSFYTDKATAAFVGFLFPTAAAAVLPLLGSPIPIGIPFALALVMAVVFWFLPDANVKSRAAAARAEFASASVSYLRLVAIQRLGSAGVVSSMEGAAKVSDAWMFQRIREELVRARMAGVSSWDALASLGQRLGVPELQEIADITRLAGESGAGITGNLMARAASMRDRLLSREQIQAARATTSMAVPIGFLVGLFMLALCYPAAMAILG